MKITNIKYTIVLILTFWMVATNAQSREKIALNDGVSEYKDGNFKAALDNFQKSYQENSNYTKALFNAGNAAYLSGDLDKATELFNQYASVENSKREVAKAHFNIGNAYLYKAALASQKKETLKDAQEHYKSAIKSFKQSLKNDPNDNDAKYNLTYALDKLQENKKQQQQQQQKDENKDDKDKKEDGDKNEDEKPGEKDGNKEDKKDDGESGDDKKDGDKGEDKEGDKSDEKKDGDGDPKEEQDKDGEAGDKNKDKDEKGEDEKDGENGNSGEQKDQEPKEVEGEISRAQAIKDLDAINSEEAKVMKKLYKSKKGDKKVKTTSGKDW